MAFGSGGLGSVARTLGDGMSALAFGLRLARRGFRLAVSERLLIAPQELMPGDPVAATEMYSGQFFLAGRTVQMRGMSPFRVEGPNAAWTRELHGFSWLRHFKDAENPVIRQHARALVAEWLGMRDAYRHPSALMPEVAARRMLSWLSHSPLLLADADHAFYQKFMRALARTALLLESTASRPSRGLVQLHAAVALTAYTLCAATREKDWKRASKLLGHALSGAVLADGTPISRNPADALSIVADLLPLRTAFTARGRTPPQELMGAVDRLMGFIRLMRHRSGEIALFNGMGATSFDLVGAILQFDDARGSPLSAAAARFGGYQRQEIASTLVLTDCGAAPPPVASVSAHAGVASFELSVGGERLVVNCGAPLEGLADIRQAVRETAAHSTLSIEGQSSARFRSVTARDGVRERQVLDSGNRPRVERTSDVDGEHLLVQHDGYQRSCGLVHERTLSLIDGGALLRGADRLQIDPRRSRSGLGAMALRFHLHPRVQASLQTIQDSVRLVLGDGSVWEFEAAGIGLRLEESIFLGGLASQRRCQQIVVPVPAVDGTIMWTFQRLSG